MTAPVDNLVAPFAAAGANMLTIHPDAAPHPHRTMNAIAAAGMHTGIALNPGAPLSLLDYLLDAADMVLLMTVNPGFGGTTIYRADVAQNRRRPQNDKRQRARHSLASRRRNQSGNRPHNASPPGRIRLWRAPQFSAATIMRAPFPPCAVSHDAPEIRGFFLIWTER